MKILLISTNFAPEIVGVGKYSSEMVDWFIENGFEVRVICAPPYYPEWSIKAGFSKYFYSLEKSKNLNIFRCPIWVPKRATGLKRVIHLVSFALSSSPLIVWQVFWKPNYIICVEPSILNSFSSLITSKISGARSILHIQDFEIDAAFKLGIIKSLLLQRFLKYVEAFIMKKFDVISTISEAMISLLSKKGISNGKTILFPNWVDTTRIFPLMDSTYRNKLKIKNDKIVCLYSGNIGVKQGLEIVLKSADLLKNTNIIFVLAGNGIALEDLKSSYNYLKNVIWLPLQPMHKLNDFLNLADIHLLPQQSGAADLVMPSKLTGILASGKPVVSTASPNTEIYKVLKGMAEVSEPGNVESFTNSILKLSKDAKLRLIYGKKCRRYAIKNLDYNYVMNKFLIDLHKIKQS